MFESFLVFPLYNIFKLCYSFIFSSFSTSFFFLTTTFHLFIFSSSLSSLLHFSPFHFSISFTFIFFDPNFLPFLISGSYLTLLFSSSCTATFCHSISFSLLLALYIFHHCISPFCLLQLSRSN